MYTAQITVMLRSAILDVQGKTVEQSLHSLGYDQIGDVRMGKHITLRIDAASQQQAEEMARRACVQLLTNPVMEDYELMVAPARQAEEEPTA